MSMDAAGLVTWTPGFDQHGWFTVKAIVTMDGGDCRTEQIFQIHVEDRNAAPTFLTQPVTVATEGITYLYAAHATDPDPDSVAYSLISGPDGMTIHPLVGHLAWTPSQTCGGKQPVRHRDTGDGPVRGRLPSRFSRST